MFETKLLNNCYFKVCLPNFLHQQVASWLFEMVKFTLIKFLHLYSYIPDFTDKSNAKKYNYGIHQLAISTCLILKYELVDVLVYCTPNFLTLLLSVELVYVCVHPQSYKYLYTCMKWNYINQVKKCNFSVSFCVTFHQSYGWVWP